MGVIYCSYCSLGIHYTDICLGGKNGKPKLTGKKLKWANWFNNFGFLVITLLPVMVVLVIGLATLVFIKGAK